MLGKTKLIVIFVMSLRDDCNVSPETIDQKNILLTGLTLPSSSDVGGLSFMAPSIPQWRGFFYIPTLSAPCSVAYKPKRRDINTKVERTGIDCSNPSVLKCKSSVSNVIHHNSRPHNARIHGVKTIGFGIIQCTNEQCWLRALLINPNTESW